MSLPTRRIASYVRQVGRILENEGARGLSRRLRGALASRIQPGHQQLPIRHEHALIGDLSHKPWPSDSLPVERPFKLNWIMTPPARGSGGHTTLFRLINHLQSRGFKNTVCFYDVYGADLVHYAETVRDYYRFQGHICNTDDGMPDAHAVLASSWPTAYAAFNAQCRGQRFYLVQDFEPSFYPSGSLAVLAENTYRMGFIGITAGKWLALKLQTEYGMAAEHFDFGCDTECYFPISDAHNASRNELAFYARPSVGRRGFELGMLALELFARDHPDRTIHLYGDHIGGMKPPFVDHGPISPPVLNQLYNRCFAGLSISFTNVSLVPHEMLAAGCIPVVNNAYHNKIVLENPLIQYATASPGELARCLSALAARTDLASLATQAISSARLTTWQTAGEQVERILSSVLDHG